MGTAAVYTIVDDPQRPATGLPPRIRTLSRRWVRLGGPRQIDQPRARCRSHRLAIRRRPCAGQRLASGGDRASRGKPRPAVGTNS